MLNLAGVQGVIFDLDGTLVTSNLNFSAMKQEIGCPQEQDILAFVADLPTDEMRQAEALIQAHEMRDAAESTWLIHGKDMVEQVRAAGLPMAIVTRNCQRAARQKITQNAIPISLVITREEAPAKPDPTALLMVSKIWHSPADTLLYVGDYIYDRQAAENAGMQWLLID